MAGFKGLENRTWPTALRGRIAIHTGHTKPSKETLRQIETRYRVAIPREQLAFGALLGTVDLVDCVTHHRSRWFQGPFGFVLRNPRPFERPIPMLGQLYFFPVDLPDSLGDAGRLLSKQAA